MSRVLRSALLVFVSVVIASSLLPQSADALVAWSINRNPNGFVNMIPGESFPTGVTVATTDEESTTTLYSRYVINNTVFSSEVVEVEPGNTVDTLITAYFTSDVMNACIEGNMAVMLELVIIQPDGTETVNYQLPWNAPCSVNPEAPAFAFPIQPTVEAVCGSNNDLIDTTSQPAGVILVADTDWIDGSRTITFGAAEGYVLEGQSEYSFVDEATPCVTEVPISPVHTQVCGPNNDVLTLMEQPEGIILASDTGWIDGVRVVIYSAVDGFVLGAPGEFTFTDVAEACTVDPEEPTDPDPVDPEPVEPKPTLPPTEEVVDPTQTPGPVTTLPETGTGIGAEVGSTVSILATLLASAAILFSGHRLRRS